VERNENECKKTCCSTEQDRFEEGGEGQDSLAFDLDFAFFTDPVLLGERNGQGKAKEDKEDSLPKNDRALFARSIRNHVKS